MVPTCSDDVHSVLDDGQDFCKFCPDWKTAALWDEWIQFGKKCFEKGLQMSYLYSYSHRPSETIQCPPQKDRSRTITTQIPILFDADRLMNSNRV
jgi:hypothetical protein